MVQLIALELLDDAGVQVLFHAFASGILPGQEGVVFETKSGPLAIKAKVIVDATGDGDVAVQAGAPCEIGRADGLVQPMTLMFRVTDFKRAAFEAYVRDNPKEWRGVHGLWRWCAEPRRKASSIFRARTCCSSPRRTTAK